MKKDVAALKKLNEELSKQCVLAVGDNSILKGEFRCLPLKFIF